MTSTPLAISTPGEFEKLDTFIVDSYQGKAQPVAGPSRAGRGTRQTTLDGPEEQTRHRAQSTPKPRNGTKLRLPSLAIVKRGSRNARDEEDEEGEPVEFEQFPAPFVSHRPPPMKLKPDLLEAKHWIYPLNQPKRDYQYNIVKHCLFDNTIVALPTGLGKTFIAGVVILSMVSGRKGRVRRPYKASRGATIEASHKSCGIPGSDAIELTGQNPRAMRARAWKEKRVFYMTPQTLNNDLETENCDAQTLSFLSSMKPTELREAMHITKSDPSAVQNLIDGLHISRIEIRDENSLDLRAYVFQKKVEQHVIAMTDDVNRIKDCMLTLIKSILKPLQNKGILHQNVDPLKLHPYAMQKRMQAIKDQPWAFSPLSKLADLARAMGYLIEGTVGMCNTYMRELQVDKKTDGDEGGKKKTSSKAKKYREDPQFQAVIKELEVQRLRGFPMHPKMDKLNTLVVQHFAQQLGDDGREGEETRVMVFVTFREAVGEIVEVLNAQKPMIRASQFIGQGADKQGRKGLAQKEQLELIKKFKAGEFNVLVATSIGEEGLDIGEVDLIVCYDAQKTPIRMLQRLGRTGRKREGIVHVLLAEGREELNMDKAEATYREVQKAIARGDHLELPEPLEKKMDIQEYVREEGRKKRTGSKEGTASKGTKRKRNDDASRNIPDGASTGFVSVAQLLVKGTSNKRKKVAVARDFDEAGQDDDTDMEIEFGTLGLPRRAASSDASTSSAPTKGKSKLRRAATEGNKRPKKTLVAPTSSQFKLKGIDDEDDMEIERGTIFHPTNPSPSSRRSHSASSPALDMDIEEDDMSGGLSPKKSPARWHSTGSTTIEIDSDSDSPPDRSHSAHSTSPGKNDMAWLLDEDDDEPDLEIVDSSPEVKRRHSPALSDDSVCVVDEPISSKAAGKRRAITPIHFGPDESVEIVEPLSPRMRVSQDPDESVELVTDASPNLPVARRAGARKLDMPPPPLPSRIFDEPESPTMEMPPPSQRRRLHRRESSPIQEGRRPKPPKNKAPSRLHITYDMEATHSGDEVSEGSSGSEDVESESDRQFVQELPETQMSPSYDQSFAYRQSLLTQAPGGGRVPHFGNRPTRKGMFGGGLSESARRRPQVSSSPPRDPDSEDAYEMGSFIVDDSAEISFLSSDS
ncbi:P-loop containing nucleoside triphosphate hydrolase protein [Mycena olivaceomarginata]|nr:P-loop containing nucleoside triphosphate hydrolase protein [Mycena olivaceomarginata]